MIEYALFHNGGADMSYKRGPSGYYYPDGTLDDVHASAQRGIVSALRQAQLADELGYQYFFQTEHHFQVEGAERNSAVMPIQGAIAALTRQIRIGQLAVVLPTWHPIRVAEHIGTLDVLSGGRVEFGIARGYQGREAETLGQAQGSTIQDQELNRAYFEECYDIIMKAWAENSISHHGEFFTLPPSWTKWTNEQTQAYFADPATKYDLENVLSITPDATTLREVSVMPQPIQSPHPQVWMGATSSRSVDWSVSKGANIYLLADPPASAKARVDTYMEASERYGWPDLLDRGPHKYGWDSERKRGVVVGRAIYCDAKGVGSRERIKMSINAEFSFYAGNGFGFLCNDENGNPPATGEYFEGYVRNGLAYVGSNEQIAASIVGLRDHCGYEEDMCIGVWFERPGLSHNEVEDQMRNFAENVMPILDREFGGTKVNPVVDPSAVPGTGWNRA